MGSICLKSGGGGSIDLGKKLLKMMIYPIGAKSFKFDMFISGTSFICIEDIVLFVCVLKTDNRPASQIFEYIIIYLSII